MAIIVVVGVTGSGKSTVGKLVAVKIGAQLVEGEQLQPAANLRKVNSGEILTDIDRSVWLHALGRRADELHRSGHSAVFTCLALKRSFRDTLLTECPDIQFVFLDAEYGHIMARVARASTATAFNPRLVEMQFAVLEPLDRTEPGVVVSTNASPDLISDRALAALGYGWALA